MRLVSLILCIFLSFAAFADDKAKPAFKEAPPPPAIDKNAADDGLEPQVTIVQKKDVVVEEYRIAGRLYKMKVIPKVGPPYYLVDERGDGQFTREDGPDAANMRPPSWVLFRF
jgi:hypothetical protein